MRQTSVTAVVPEESVPSAFPGAVNNSGCDVTSSRSTTVMSAPVSHRARTTLPPGRVTGG